MGEVTNMDLCPIPLPPRSQPIPNPVRVPVVKPPAIQDKPATSYSCGTHASRKLQVCFVCLFVYLFVTYLS